MDILFTLLSVLLCVLIIRNHRFFKIDGVKKEAMLFAFLLKIFAGALIFLIYTYYYPDRTTADIFKYFDDSKIMANAMYDKPLDFLKMFFSFQNDTPYFTDNYYNHMNNWFRVYDSNLFSDSHLIIRFNALIMIFSFGVYHVHTVVVCFLSFIGLTALFKFFIEYNPKAKLGLFLAIYTIPSVVFWGSGVLKEGLIFFALGMLIYHGNHLFEKINIRKLLILLLSVVLLLYTKIYVFVIVFPLFVIFNLLKHQKSKNISLTYFATTLLVFLISFLFFKNFAKVDIFQMLAQKQHDFILLSESQNPGSYLTTAKLNPSLWSFIQYLPTVIMNTMLRPIVGLDNSIIMIPSFLENILTWTLICLSIIFPSKRTPQQWLMFQFLLWIVIGFFLITGFTTPILGAIVRYKSIALPFLGVLFCFSISKKKLCNSSRKIATICQFFEKKIVYKSTLP